MYASRGPICDLHDKKVFQDFKEGAELLSYKYKAFVLRMEPDVEKTDEELYDLILPKGSKQEKAFIRLVVTFVTLVKSSCKSVEEVLKQAKNKDDERSVFIIKNILGFSPLETYLPFTCHQK